MTDMDPKLKQSLTGVSGILVAPFDGSDAVDAAPLGPIIDRAVEAGVHVLVANGNTGEFYGLRAAENEAMLKAAAERIGGRVPLVSGVGKSIGDACDLARLSREVGASAIMVHQPPDPFVAPRGIHDYVARVAEAADGLPVILYLRNDAMGVENIARLCEIPSVVAVKWATPNVMTLSAAMARADESIVWICGLAETWAPAMTGVGATGFTSGLINVWPARSVAIHDALAAGDFGTARALISEISVFEALRAEELNGTNVSVVKAALAVLGEECGACRPPAAWPLTADQTARLRRALMQWGLQPSGTAGAAHAAAEDVRTHAT
jgi:4-hydroxy-tetrahydrodipicolinate synthase